LVATLLAVLALAAGPPPGAPIPRDPAALAAKLDTTTNDLAAATDRWQPRTGRVPEDVTLYALYQQRILILLSEKTALSKAVFSRLRAPELESEVAARRELGRLSKPRPLKAFRTGPAEPADRLRGHYLEAQRRFGVAWNVLAAINYVESAFNKLRNASSAGAQGPMQFIPSTWRAYGLGGDVHDPHDAILGAANYLPRERRPAQLPPRPLPLQPVLVLRRRRPALRERDPQRSARLLRLLQPPGLRPDASRSREADRAALTDYG
jgi:membrane-bound lytic murein transglycosylase B